MFETYNNLNLKAFLTKLLSQNSTLYAHTYVLQLITLAPVESVFHSSKIKSPDGIKTKVLFTKIIYYVEIWSFNIAFLYISHM